MNHLGDTNKMVDTPRTDEVWERFGTDTTGELEPDVEFSTLARQLERELNEAKYRIKRLEKAGDKMERWCSDLEATLDWLKAKEDKL